MATKAKGAPHADLVGKAPNFKQKAFADWIEQQTGYEVDLKSVQLALSLTGPWRRSDVLTTLRANHVTVRERNKQDAAKRRVEREQNRIAKLKEQLAALEGKPPAAETPADAPAPDNVRELPQRSEKRAAAKTTAKKAAPAKAAPAKAAPAKAAPAKAAPAKRAPRKAASMVAATSGAKPKSTVGSGSAAAAPDDDEF